VLIKDKGVPTAQAIDAYRPYVQAYNGSGPLAAGYADRVIRRGVACASTIGRRQPCTKQVVGVPVPCG